MSASNVPGLRVEQVMTPNPISVEEGTSLKDAVRLMRKHKIGSVIVVNRRGVCRGIVIESLITQALLIEGKQGLMDILVDEYMIENPPSVGRGDDIRDVYKIMTMQSINHVVVIERMYPIGVISHKDILRTLGLDEAEEPT